MMDRRPRRAHLRPTEPFNNKVRIKLPEAANQVCRVLIAAHLRNRDKDPSRHDAATAPQRRGGVKAGPQLDIIFDIISGQPPDHLISQRRASDAGIIETSQTLFRAARIRHMSTANPHPLRRLPNPFRLKPNPRHPFIQIAGACLIAAIFLFSVSVTRAADVAAVLPPSTQGAHPATAPVGVISVSDGHRTVELLRPPGFVEDQISSAANRAIGTKESITHLTLLPSDQPTDSGYVAKFIAGSQQNMQQAKGADLIQPPTQESSSEFLMVMHYQGAPHPD